MSSFHIPHIRAPRYSHLTLICYGYHHYVSAFFFCTGLHCHAHAFSSCGERGLLSSCDARASHCGGFSCCGARHLGEQAQQLWLMGLAAPWHVESSWTRDRTCVSHTAGQILNHQTTRKSCIFKHYDYANSAFHVLFVRDCRRYQKRSPTRISVMLSKPKYFLLTVRSRPE